MTARHVDDARLGDIGLDVTDWPTNRTLPGSRCAPGSTNPRFAPCRPAASNRKDPTGSVGSTRPSG